MFPRKAVDPRRYVDKRGNQMTVTRKSAPARIAAAPHAVPFEVAVPSLEVPGDAPRPVRFSLSPSATPRRSRSPKPSRRRTLDFAQDASDSSGDESDSSYASFTLDMKKKDLLQASTSLGGPLAPPRTMTDRSVSPEMKSAHGSRPTLYRVLKSSYDGELFRNGKLSANLIVGPEKLPNQPEYFKPLFKWFHLQNPEMNFGAFIELVTRCPYLDEAERDAAGSILRTAREKSDRSLRMPSGMKGIYVEAEYFEETISSTLCQGPRAQRSKTEVVRWVSIPYFYLGSAATPYVGKGPANQIPNDLPSFSKQGSICRGEFFQVAQFWSLMLGDGLLFTCTRMSISDIPGSLINFKFIPPADPARPLTGERDPVIQVSDGGLRVWLLPVEQCESWNSFCAIFVGLGFSLVDGWEVKYRDISLGKQDWHRIVLMAKRTSVRIQLCRRNRATESEDDFSHDAESDEDIESTPAAQPTGKGTQAFSITQEAPASPTVKGPNDPGQSLTQPLRVEDFHVFTFLATTPEQPAAQPQNINSATAGLITTRYKVNEKQLQEDLTEVDCYLSTKNSRTMESPSYNQCPTADAYQVENSIAQLKASRDGSLVDREECNSKIVFEKAACEIFQLFLPLRYEHAVTRKYWGAVDRIINTEAIQNSQGQFESVARELLKTARVAKEIREDVFSEDRIAEYIAITVPHEFVQGFMFIVMFFVLFPSTERAKSYVARCKDRLSQGRLKAIERLQPISIREREAVLPLGIYTLLLGQLLHDSQGPLLPERHRLTSAYWNFFKAFKEEIHNKPLSRKLQEKFVTLKAELEAIINYLEDQQRVLVALEDSINEAESHSIENADPFTSRRIFLEPNRELSIVEYTLHETEEMLQNFAEMSRRTNDLEAWQQRVMASNSDMQDRASMTFTTVTVFCLPLTTLASILGMNTIDIRNMNQTQWVFWAVGSVLCVASLTAWMLYLNSFNVLGRQHRKILKGR